jgi:hypothetical protein
MYFLKCNNCGHLNEVKTEYLSFCSKCNKKLENNFSGWQRKYPEKSFDDYKKLICISDAEIPQEDFKSKRLRPKSLKYWIGFTVSFAIMYAIGQFGGEAIVKFFKSEKTSKEVLSQKWIKESYGDYGLTVETPVILTKAEMAVPENLQQMIEKADAFNYVSAKGFKIMITTFKYKPELTGYLDLQSAANGAVNSLKMQKGVTDFDYTEEKIFKDDIPGFMQKGKFKQDGTGIEFINSVFSSGLILWQVWVIYQEDDEIGRIASKRVLDSIEINLNSKSV